MGRVLGLSINDKPRRLLSTINKMPQSNKQLPPAVEDPPFPSSDDEDASVVDISPCHDSNASQPSRNGQRPGSRQKRHCSLSDSTCDERAGRGSIAQTNFIKAPKARMQQRARRKRSETIESLDPGAKESDDDQASSNKRRRNSRKPPSTHRLGKGASTAPPSSSGDHFKDKHGFVKAESGRETYKRAARDKSKEQAEKKAAATNRLANGTSRQTTGAKENAQLNIPDVLYNSPKKPREGIQIPGNVPGSSPRRSPQTLRTKFSGADKLSDNESDGLNASSPVESRRANNAKRSRDRGKWQPPERFPMPTRHVLEMPARISDLGRGANGNDSKPETVLSDVASDAEKSNGSLSDLEVISSDEEAGTAPTVCPWCGQPVDKSLLDDFSRGKRMNVRLQARFCQQHKKQTAMETWKAKSYPEVDWEGLDRRFAAHCGFLLGIVNGKDSHFRRILAQRIESGQARSMKKEGNMNPGYYGPRGFDLMCDYLVDEFGELLRGKAIDDRVIAGRGSAAFIQTVLVAELAVQLIKDDMGVSAEEARRIMEESKALGEMVHEGT